MRSSSTKTENSLQLVTDQVRKVTGMIISKLLSELV